MFLSNSPPVHDPELDLTVIFDPESNRPYIIRTLEYHTIYGTTTNDLYLTDYKAVGGIMFPHHVQTVYNATTQSLNAPLEDYVVEKITVNPNFSSDFFNGLSDGNSFYPRAAPKKVQGVSHAHLTEFSSNMLWGGITNSTVDRLEVTHPILDLPQVHWIVLDNETLGVKQLVLEFENEVIVGDAPPQWTTNVIQWISENLGKPVTHIWVSF